MFGSFVRDVRQSRGLSQSDLAEVSGIRQSNISAIEHDRRVPSADTLNRLLVACGYELKAVAGPRTIACPLPRVGWFPDEDLPPSASDDPASQPPAIGPDAPMEQRVRAITAVLEAVDAAMASGQAPTADEDSLLPAFPGVGRGEEVGDGRG